MKHVVIVHTIEQNFSFFKVYSETFSNTGWTNNWLRRLLGTGETFLKKQTLRKVLVLVLQFAFISRHIFRHYSSLEINVNFYFTLVNLLHIEILFWVCMKRPAKESRLLLRSPRNVLTALVIICKMLLIFFKYTFLVVPFHFPTLNQIRNNYGEWIVNYNVRVIIIIYANYKKCLTIWRRMWLY